MVFKSVNLPGLIHRSNSPCCYIELGFFFVMSTATLMRMRSARPTGPRLRVAPAGLSIQARSKTTMPFRLPDARNEPNVS